MLRMNAQTRDFRSMDYVRALRSVGRLLQMRDLQAFELNCHGGEFQLRCGYQKPPCSTPVEMRYSMDEMASLESEYQQESDGLNRTVDFYSLSEVLQGIGAYVLKRDGRIVKISNNESSLAAGSVKLQYQTSDGDLREEVFTLPSIYELCVRLYKERAKPARATNLFAGSRA